MISAWKRANIHRFFDSDPNYTRCAKECHVDPKTVHKYTDSNVVPKRATKRAYRTRTAPLDAYWPEIKALLENDPKLKPYAILEFMLDKYKTDFDSSWRRTLERRMERWAIDNQIAKDVTCSQVHQPGDVLAFDFTEVASLNIMVASVHWRGLLFHATLTYSNWEYAELALSESFEAVVSGVQNAFLELGGVTRRLRSDSLTAAVNNHNSKHNFQIRYKSFLEHFGVIGHRINVRKPEENGDCESSHGHLKDYLDQQLRLRGSRNFETLDQLRAFVAEKILKRNLKRREQWARDRVALNPLPPSQFPTFTQVDIHVPSTSVIRIKQNAYSIPSHLIDCKIESRIYADHIALWYRGRKVLEMPRLIGTGQVSFDYCDVIDSLVRKPGGFVNYRYREYMFPTITFRKAFDIVVVQLGEQAGVKCYLKILYMAKHHGQVNVESELHRIIELGETIDPKAIEAKVNTASPASLVEDPLIEQPDLETYNALLEHKEVLDEPDQFTDNRANETATEPCGTGWPFGATAASDDSINGDRTGGSSGPGELEPSPVSRCSDDSRGGQTDRESSVATYETLGVGEQQNMVSDSLVAAADGGSTSNAATSDRGVREASGEPVDVRQAGFWENAVTQCTGGTIGSPGTHGVLRSVRKARSASVARQARVSTTATATETWPRFGVDHRRHWIRAAESGGDGSIVYVDSGSIRTNESNDQQQPAIFEVGADLQGSDDNRRRDRSLGASQHDHRAEREQLPPGGSPSQTAGSDKPGGPHCRIEINKNPVRNFSCR